MTIRAFYDRQPGTITGAFTLQSGTVKLFDRLPARSGQRGHEGTSWIRGKSPIPFGEMRLWLSSLNRGQMAGERGIGEFFPISSGDNRRLIAWRELGEGPAPGGTGERWDVGLHPENALPGSLGCIVLLTDTPQREAQVRRLFTYLNDLSKTQPWMRLTVL